MRRAPVPSSNSAPLAGVLEFKTPRGSRPTGSSGGGRNSARWLTLAVVLVLLVYVALAAYFTVGMITGQGRATIPGLMGGGGGGGSRMVGGGDAIQTTGKDDDIPPHVETQQLIKKTVDPNDDIHFVFSTGCNYFQHWQAEVLLHSHWSTKQRGKITRVVSGCDTEHIKRQHAKFLTHPEGLADETVPMEELQKSSHPNFFLHVTPSFEGAREFPWMNKPNGLAHWLANSPNVNESVIVILDPDQFFMDTLKQDGSKSLQGSMQDLWSRAGLLCSEGCRGGKYMGIDVLGMSSVVKEGRPVAQTYGLGGDFVHRYDIKGMAGADSPAARLTSREAAQYYSVGPPMMMHVKDLRRVMPLWVKFMHPVFNAVPGDIQADMYAYSIAAAHLELPHLMLDQYMVSSPVTSGEGWPFTLLKDDSVKHPCSDPNKYVQWPPTFLHVAQRYDSEDWPMFHKGHVPPNILQCDLPLIMDPPEDLIDRVPVSNMKQRHKNYMLCNAYVLTNRAALAWKKKFCPNGYNADKEIRLQKKDQSCKREDQGKKCWVFATWDKKLNAEGFKIRTYSPGHKQPE